MQGRHRPLGEKSWKPGDYWQENGVWLACTPSGDTGDLSDHEVVEHEDGTITVNPSIEAPTYHGWLKRGVWSEG